MRKSFAHLVIPAAVGVLYYHAHVRSAKPTGSWREGAAVVTGNPYSTPLSRATWALIEADPTVEIDDDDDDDQFPKAVADLNTPDDAR